MFKINKEIIDTIVEDLDSIRNTPLDTHNKYTIVHSQQQRSFASKILRRINSLGYRLDLLIEELMDMKNTPIDNHNEFTIIHSEYQKKFASNLLIDINELKRKLYN